MVLRLSRIPSQVLRCLGPLQRGSSQEKGNQAVDIANRGDPESESFDLLLEGYPLKKITGDPVIVSSKSVNTPVSGGAERLSQKTCILAL